MRFSCMENTADGRDSSANRQHLGVSTNFLGQRNISVLVDQTGKIQVELPTPGGKMPGDFGGRT